MLAATLTSSQGGAPGVPPVCHERGGDGTRHPAAVSGAASHELSARPGEHRQSLEQEQRQLRGALHRRILLRLPRHLRQELKLHMRMFVLSLCFLAMCSGRPQEDCSAEGHCEHMTTFDPDTTTTTPDPTTMDGGDGDDEDDGPQPWGAKSLGLKAKSLGLKAKSLARQGEIGGIRAPLPGPIPFPGPIEREVAFSVRKATTFRSPTRVEFDDVLANVGGGWSRRRAHFEAPYKGGYYFSFHAVAERRNEFTLALMKNNVYQVTAYGTQGDYQHGSNSVFLELNRGQRVHLQLQEGVIYEHPHREAYTTFTGFMVYRN